MTEGKLPRKRQARNVAKARDLRANMSLPEVLLWRLLRDLPDGPKFRRQHPLGPYVLDFYCTAKKLCVEIDGIAHDMGGRPARDAVRDASLTEQGIEVIRIAAIDVLRSPAETAEAIVHHCRA
jgi:very-short-patch-repair endonuclease